MDLMEQMEWNGMEWNAVIFIWRTPKIPRRSRVKVLQRETSSGRVEGRSETFRRARCIESFAGGVVIDAPALRRGKQTLQHCLSQRNTLVFLRSGRCEISHRISYTGWSRTACSSSGTDAPGPVLHVTSS